MTWGKKKKASIASSSSTTSSSHSHVFPRSWLSKFKLSSEKPVSVMAKNSPSDVKKQNLERPSSRASSLPTNSGYYKDEDGFWRGSFGGDDDNMGFGGKFAVSSQPFCVNCKANVKEVARNKRIVQEPKKVPGEMIVREKERVAKEEILQRTYNRIVEATEELHRELDEVDGYRKSVEKDLSEKELLEVMQMVGRAKEPPPSINTSKSPTSWQELKDAKIKQVLLKNEKQRKSFHISRELNKVKVQSPRTPSKTETCKIRALEDMKRAKLKKKAKEIEQEDRGKTLGSFAVVKRSHDPQRDFKESMVEMIIEKGIRRPDEFEELLACYLTLNADEYHDLIVKVFRQVWCELVQSPYS